PVTVKFYFSESLPNVPLQVKTFARKVRELLEEYETAGHGQIAFELFDPKPDTELEEWAIKYGLQRVALADGSNLYFGLVAIAGEREIAVPFFDTRREKFIEYDISEAITRAMRRAQPKLGILSYLPVSGSQPNPLRPPEPEWAVISELRRQYKVEYLLPDMKEIAKDIDLVMLIHPKYLPTDASYALDQFLLRGGRMIIFNDPNARTDSQARETQGIQITYSNVPKLLEGWGLEFDKTKVVGDQQLATRVNTQNSGVVDFPIWITFRDSYINRESPVTSQLEEVTLIDTGAFKAGEKFKYTFTPLLTTSAASGQVDGVLAQMAGPLDIMRNLKPDGQPRVVAAIISGTFDTAFPNGPIPEQSDPGFDEKAKEEAIKSGPPKGHLAKGERPTSVILVGDADFMADQFSVQTVNLLGRPIIQPINDNVILVLNAVEFLSGNQNLIGIRSRGKFSRPFTTVLSLQQEAQSRYQVQEEQLSQRLEQVQKRLAELESSKTTGGESQRFILTPEMLKEVEKFREEERQTQQALREVRKVLRQDIEELGNRLLLTNLLAMPLFVLIFGFVIITRRIRKSGGKT
ncbi:MAG: Gldg family protein, partial [Candidatus Lambdaproteobacteria bacterium]|nr:Gldg family protein [Candidatus Lambdaproteobacteria bacterium]